MGHGSVVGCVDTFGYEFKQGFSKANLFENYKLSVIGDIHRLHLHKSDDRYIIQPGTPVCQSFSDYPINGVWISELGEEPKFVNNETFTHFNEYYTFKTVDSESECVSTRPYTFFKLKKKQPKDFVQIDKTITSNTDILELYKDICNKDNQETIEIFEKIYKESGGIKVRVPVGVTLKEIKISNFLSIGSLNLDFIGLDQLLVVGKNGSGKSSLFAAVFFALTGEIDKSLDLNSLVKSGEESLKIELSILVDKKEYIIVRSRTKSASTLDLLIDGVSMRAASIKDTQSNIYDIIGANSEDLLTFSYFSALTSVSFSSMSGTQKYEVISKLSRLDLVDSIRNKTMEYIKVAKEKVSNFNFYKKQLSQEISNIESRLSLSLDPEEVNVDTLNKERDEISNDLELLVQQKSTYDIELEKYRNLQLRIKSRKNQLDFHKKEYEKLNSMLTSLKSNICPECNQHFTGKDSLDKIKSIESAITQCLSNATLEKEELNKLLDSNCVMEIKDFSNIDKLKRKRQVIDLKLQDSMKSVSRKSERESLALRLKDIEDTMVETESSLNVANLELNNLQLIKNVVDRSGQLTTKLVESVIQDLNSELSKILCKSKLSIKLVYNKTVEIFCKINKTVLGYNSLSSGERKLVELSMIVAFNNLYNSTFRLEKGILGTVFLDELFTYLDPENLLLCKEILDELQSNFVIITHEDELKSMFPRKLIVEKTDSTSQYTLV